MLPSVSTWAAYSGDVDNKRHWRGSSTHVAASSEDLAVRRKSVAILLKVLSYDRQLETRCPDAVRIGVVARSTDSRSVSQASVTMQALVAFKGKKLKGKPILAQVLLVERADQVAEAVAAKGINTLFLNAGVSDMVEPLAKMGREKKVLVLSSEGDYVKKGAALAVIKGPDNKPKILVNVEAAKAQGAALDARVLKMAEAVR